MVGYSRRGSRCQGRARRGGRDGRQRQGEGSGLQQGWIVHCDFMFILERSGGKRKRESRRWRKNIRRANSNPERRNKQRTPQRIASALTMVYTCIRADEASQQDGHSDHPSQVDRICNRHYRRCAWSVPHARRKKRIERPPSGHGRQDQHCQRLRTVQVTPIAGVLLQWPPHVPIDKDTKEIQGAEQYHYADSQ